MRHHLTTLLILLVGVAAVYWFRPMTPERQHNLGVQAHDRGDWAEAESRFTAALADDSFRYLAEAHSMRGRVREQLGRAKEAMADHDAAILLKPGHPNIRAARAAARMDQGDIDGALWDYSEALRIDPTYVDARYNRGIILLALATQPTAETPPEEAAHILQEAEADLAQVQGVRTEPRQKRIIELKPREP